MAVELPNVYVPPATPLPGDLPILGLTRSILVVDTETGGPVDLKKRGQANYWADPETRTYMIGYKRLNDGPDCTGLFDWETAGPQDIPPALKFAIDCPPQQCMLATANVDFDRAALKERGYDTPHEKWLDVLSCAYFLGFAGGLDQVLKQTPLEIAKDPEGTRLITLFSVKRTPWYEAPDKWERFKQYCRQDAHVEELLLRWCLHWLNTPKYAPIVRDLQRQEIRYRKINARGIPVDRAAVRGALQLRDSEVARLLDEMREITGLPNPNSRDQLLKWLRENGARIGNLQKDTVRDALNGAYGDLPAQTARVLRLRQETGKTSTKKFDALELATSPDDRLRNGWRFYGASRTGRVGGRVLNPANLARPAIKYPDLVAEWLAVDPTAVPQAFGEKEPLDTLSSTVRACLKAPKGKRWAVADLTSIESVGAAWLAGCKKIMDIFYEGRDTYRTFAAAAEGIDYEAVTKEQRTLYKPVVLGGAYQLSGPGLVAYAASMGVTMNEAHANAQITAFREEYHEVTHYWWQLKNAAISAVKNPGRVYSAHAVAESHNPWGEKWDYIYAPWPRVDYLYDETFLICTLPSGRCLFYYKPRVDDNYEISMRDGSTFTTQALLYWGIDQKATGNFWQEISTHGGKILENNNQAICRDILWNGLEPADDDPDLEVLGDVYDELMTLIKAGDVAAYQRLLGYMTRRAPWMRDTRFFLGADGYISTRYRKD